MGSGLTGRRVMRIIETGDPIGAVEFDGQTLALEGQARLILGKLREATGDDVKFGQDLIEYGWMNMVVQLGPLEEFDEDGEEPDLDEIRGYAEQDDDEDDVERAAGHDVTPGHDELHHYWTLGPGKARWVGSKTPWRTLYALVTKAVRKNGRAVSPEQIKRWVSRWYIEVFHMAANSDKARVLHGHPPRGHRVGPG